MTLIFTNPLFTMLFAAIFLGHRLTFIKNVSGEYCKNLKCLLTFYRHCIFVSALILMAGIILVTKPPFLFPPQVNSNGTTSLFRDYLDRNYVMYNLNSK